MTSPASTLAVNSSEPVVGSRFVAAVLVQPCEGSTSRGRPLHVSSARHIWFDTLFGIISCDLGRIMTVLMSIFGDPATRTPHDRAHDHSSDLVASTVAFAELEIEIGVIRGLAPV